MKSNFLFGQEEMKHLMYFLLGGVFVGGIAFFVFFKSDSQRLEQEFFEATDCASPGGITSYATPRAFYEQQLSTDISRWEIGKRGLNDSLIIDNGGKLEYLWVESNQEIVSGTYHLPEDAVLYLHFPADKWSTLYLTGNGQSLPIITEISHSCGETACNERGYYMVLGGAFSGPSLFHLPRKVNNAGIVVTIFSYQGEEIFRELSNRESYLQKEGSSVWEYLSGVDYPPKYSGLEPFLWSGECAI